MAEVTSLGNVLVLTGGLLVLLGLVVLIGGKIPFFGNLPGDISIERGNFKFYAPIATFLVISIVLTVLLNLLSK
ncbi:MAG: DUF2905 domain-containing protein [Candidatus Aenigmarchaeota archaeon]|nr:DUF2905 domain-containing protein [Candidatus Aenigmarchaeota archaeon]